MKIAMMFTQLEVGGAQTRVFQTAHKLREHGHDVDIFCIYQARLCFENEVKTILAPSKRPLDALRSMKSLFFKLKNGNYDVFISNTAPANIIGNFIALLAGVKLRFAWHTQPPENVNPLIRKLDSLWTIFRVYTFCVANSNWTFSKFNNRSKSYRSRLVTISDGIEPRIDDRDQDVVRTELGIFTDKKVLLTVGRLSKQKGQETLISAMRDIDSAILYIVGDGENRKMLQDYAIELGVADKVVFVGEVPGKKVASYFRASDIFVFPSRWETFGLAVVEAAASGLPIVHSDIDVLKEVTQLPDGSFAGETFPLDDAKSLAQVINRIIPDKDALTSMRHKSLAIGRLHSLDAHVKKIEDLIAKSAKGLSR